MFPIVFNSNHRQITQNYTSLIEASLLAMTDTFSFGTSYTLLSLALVASGFRTNRTADVFRSIFRYLRHSSNSE